MDLINKKLNSSPMIPRPGFVHDENKENQSLTSPIKKDDIAPKPSIRTPLREQTLRIDSSISKFFNFPSDRDSILLNRSSTKDNSDHDDNDEGLPSFAGFEHHIGLEEPTTNFLNTKMYTTKEYDDLIKQHKQQVNSMSESHQKEIRSLHQQIDTKDMENDKLKRLLNDKDDELNVLTERIEKLSYQLARSSKELKFNSLNFESELKKRSSTIEKLISSNKELESSNAQLKEKSREDEVLNDKLNKENNKLNDQLNELSSKYNDLDNEISLLKAVADNAEVQTEELSKSLARKEQEIEDWNSRFAGANEEIASLNIKVTELQEENTKLIDNNQHIEQDNQILTENIESLKQGLENASKALEEATTQQTGELLELREASSNSQLKIEELGSENQELQTRLAEAQEQNLALTNRVNELQVQHEKTSEVFAQLEEIRVASDNLLTTNSTLTEQNSELQNKLLSVYSQLESKENTISELVSRFGKLKSQFTSQKAKLTEANEQLKEQEEQLNGISHLRLQYKTQCDYVREIEEEKKHFKQLADEMRRNQVA